MEKDYQFLSTFGCTENGGSRNSGAQSTVDERAPLSMIFKTVLVSSKFIFNLGESVLLVASASSAERCSKISANTLSVHVPKNNASFLSLHKLSHEFV